MMKPEEVRKMEEEEDEEFIGLNVETTLLDAVQKLFKTEPEVEVFYDGFLERVQNDKRLRKNKNNRRLMNEAFLDELLKYHELDKINNAINNVSVSDESNLVEGDDEKDVDKLLRKTFKDKMEFRMFMTYISQYMMELGDSPVEACAKSMKRLGKSDADILKITSVINKIF
ncbi:hypothetical protein [Methanosphaera sp. WGK6]|uniref:hypothetical protein n=1 Tax=Methanosphaera sp. WGK6 TaxID=1561964 RepID=UPI00117EF089|nr:hypothetical protein [Methanosphaera sp. WGK6]